MNSKRKSGWLSGHGGSRKRKSLLNTLKDPGRIVPFCKAQRSVLLSSFLVAAIIALLFGIFSQLQAPSTSDTPAGEMALSYSAFLAQVNAGNVLTVTMRGNEVNALLRHPLTGASVQKTPVISPTQSTAQIEVGSRYAGSMNRHSGTSSIDPARLVSTNLPATGAGQLVSLLMNKHITLITQPSNRTPAWLGLLWKCAPLLFSLFLVAIVLRPRKQARISQKIDEQIAQFTKLGIRRFEGARSTLPRDGQDKQASEPVGQSSTPLYAPLAPASSTAARPIRTDHPPTTFADVAGIDEVRLELEEIVQFLRSPKKFARLGARIPRGALLVGPPGTGKTLLARAVAGEARVPFFSISASEFVEIFVGVGASRVRDLFEQARRVAPAVIFIDEIDAVGRKRAMKMMNSEERDQTLNQLLVEMDGFHANRTVVVLAATNRVDILDKALLRPGRFDRHIMVSLPDHAGRQAILQIHSAKTPLHEEVSLERLARLTTGMSGADLANLVNEAALCAARKDLERVDQDCFEEALARVQLGALRQLVMTEAERRIIAYHESGHALVAYHLKEAGTVNRVTILPRGQSLGVTQLIAEEDRYNYSREMLMAKIAVGLGGRVAEELTLGREQVTTRAENDFQMVTSLARRMVTRWGMSDEIGVVCVAHDGTSAGLKLRHIDPATLATCGRTVAIDAGGQLVPSSEAEQSPRPALAIEASAVSGTSSASMNSLVDREVKKIVDEGHAMAQGILREHFTQLERLAGALMEREQLGRAGFEALMLR